MKYANEKKAISAIIIGQEEISNQEVIVTFPQNITHLQDDNRIKEVNHILSSKFDLLDNINTASPFPFSGLSFNNCPGIHLLDM